MLSPSAVTVPFDPSKSIIAVHVQLQGRTRKTVSLALDTGATYVMIPLRNFRFCLDFARGVFELTPKT